MAVHRHITVILDMTREDVQERLKAHGIDSTPQVVSEVIQFIRQTAIDAASTALVDCIEQIVQKENNKQ